ncbi:glycosyltransferase family 2 protein [Solemya velesiana gill symbiont]|uniref:Glycosyl transferase n=1 Tax=Solemya velesiana gill symbiont TaxID=1918948 RepID=A0A1T2KVS6_9GAMM|nr:glycosyltransferase [Solemya velesiana gill symbiont]OOZ36945.1 glycosyl transferase [Solemya velesiana gill symbiont]
MYRKPLISVCVANFNGMDVINDCLYSTINQDIDEQAIEIIVHDDASTDESAAYIKDNFPHIQLLESDHNVGFCVANNRMAAMARGEFILLLNNDAALYPDALTTLYHTAQNTLRPTILSLPQYEFETGELIDRGSLLDPFLNPTPNKNPDRDDVAMVMGACLWIPKALWDELGGFPEWFGSIGEDLYLCCRARLAGHLVRVCNQSGYKHKVGASFGGGKINKGRLSTAMKRRALSERNKTYVMLISYPWQLALLIFIPHLLLLHVEGLVLSLVKWNKNLWREIYAPLLGSLWQERDRLWSTRKEVQQKRAITLVNWLKPFHWLPWKITMAIKHGLPEVK